MASEYRISAIWRILSAALGLASAMLLFAHAVSDGLFNWFEIAVIVGFSGLFFYVAVSGKSPKWVDGQVTFFPEEK